MKMSTGRRASLAVLSCVSTAALVLSGAIAQASETAPTAVPGIDVEAAGAAAGDNGAIAIGEPAKPEGRENYVVTRTSTGSKVDLPNNYIPQSIATVPQKILQDQDSRSVVEALQNVAGVVNPYPSYYPLETTNSAYIRGFPVSMTLHDGLWDPTPQGNGWMTNVERIEVLKGPSGLLYGAYSGGIGGVIDVISKKPLPTRTVSASAGVNTYGGTYFSGDISTPLVNQDWLLRTTFNLGNYNTFADNSRYTKRDASVVLQGRLTSDDAITLGYEYRWQNTHPYSGAPGYAQKGSGTTAYLAPLGSFPYDINVYDPRSFWTYESNTARAVYEHRFNEDWSFKSSNQFTVTSRDALSVMATPSFLASGAAKYTQSFQEIRMGPVYAFDTDNLIHGHFDTFGIKHDLIFGERYANIHYNMNMARPTPYTFSSYFFTDPNNPNWGQPANNVQQYMFGYSSTNQADSYINDVISLTDKWRIVGGVNYVNYETYSRSGMNPASMGSSRTTGEGPAWRVGMLYDILPGVTPFVGYGTTLQPQTANITNTGEIQKFDPLTGTQIEGGVKYQVSDKASLTASVYQIELSNVTETDPDPARALANFKVQTGKQRSRGVELDGGYTIQPGWFAQIAYAYTDARIVSDSAYVVGSRTPYVPNNTLRLWSTYEIQEGDYRGFGFGGGMTFTDARTTNVVSQSTPNLYATLPAYATFDALAFYKFDKGRLSLNVKNIFDRRYFESATSYAWLYRGEPLNASLRLDVTF